MSSSISLVGETPSNSDQVWKMAECKALACASCGYEDRSKLISGKFGAPTEAAEVTFKVSCLFFDCHDRHSLLQRAPSLEAAGPANDAAGQNVFQPNARRVRGFRQQAPSDQVLRAPRQTMTSSSTSSSCVCDYGVGPDDCRSDKSHL